jgi:hypothetical protein
VPKLPYRSGFLMLAVLCAWVSFGAAARADSPGIYVGSARHVTFRLLYEPPNGVMYLAVHFGAGSEAVRLAALQATNTQAYCSYSLTNRNGATSTFLNLGRSQRAARVQLTRLPSLNRLTCGLRPSNVVETKGGRFRYVPIVVAAMSLAR